MTGVDMNMMTRLPFQKNSLRSKLMLSVFILTLPFLVMLLSNNLYAIDVVRNQVADSYKNTLTLHMNQIDSQLGDIDSYLNTLIGNGYDIIALTTATTDDEYYTAKSYIYNKLTHDIPLYRLLGAYFVFVQNRQDYMDVFSTQISYDEREKIEDYIRQVIGQKQVPKGVKTKRWHYANIGEEDYLINIVQSGSNYVGGWIHVNELLKPLEAIDIGAEGKVIIASEDGKAITERAFIEDSQIQLKAIAGDHYISGVDRKYLVVGTESYRGNIQLVTIIPESKILSKLPYLQTLIWIVSATSLVFIILGFYYFRHSFLMPIKRILHAMSKVRVGDWSVRVDLDRDSEEFKILGHSFNNMMSEVQRLRVNVLEAQINKQTEELQRLQLQVNPHFYLNSLNIIYNLAKVKNFSLIMDMSSALSKYFRFLFRSNTSFVLLKEELEHTRNYLSIQSMRFPTQLQWGVEAPEYVNDVPIPPLIIQSLVENSVKYAVTMEKTVNINVTVHFREHEDGDKLMILIQDSGDGFEEHILQVLQAGRTIQNRQGEHTGIWNVQRRLKLLYNEKAELRFYNNQDTGGAAVEILLPIHPEREGV